MSRTNHKEKAEKRTSHKADCNCWNCDKVKSYKRRQLELKAKENEQ